MSTKKEVPEAIITAINVMLAPYGWKFEDIDETIVKRIEEPRFINVKDAASYSGMSRWLVRFGARQGFYATRKTGSKQKSRLLIDKKSFDNWIDSRASGQTQNLGESANA